MEYPPEFREASNGVDPSGAGVYWWDYDNCVPDWDSVIGLGFTGLLKRAQNYYQEKIDNGTITPDQEIFYTGVETVYKAILRLMNRFLECAKKHIEDDEIKGAKNIIAQKGLKILEWWNNKIS